MATVIPEPKANPLPPTILSALQQFTSQDILPTESIHPFSTNAEETLATLRRVLDTANQALLSVDAHLSSPLSNAKLLSLYRQQTAIAHAVQQSEQNIRHTVSSLRKRVGIVFGEDIPVDRTRLVDWFLDRLLQWGKSAEMEAFHEPEQNGHITVVLGGKVLVVDVDFSIDRSDPTNPVIGVATVKTAYAIPNSAAASSTGNSLSLDGFLAECIKRFLEEVQKDSAHRDSVRAAKLGEVISDSLIYLMRLDQLALNEGDGGLRWFTYIDRMALEVEALASSEADVICKSRGIKGDAPLDVFLMRARPLPLPYLTTPSISFLTYLSPLAYLKLLRSRPSGSSPSATSKLPRIDVPFNYLRTLLAAQPRPAGTTTATLVLAPVLPPAYHADPMTMTSLDTRAASSLVADGPQIECVFPAAAEPAAPLTWLLDFTAGGAARGVVMRQSRMREIELVVNPFGGMDPEMHAPHIMAFGTGSWVDLLLNPQTPISPERYTAVYTSPSNMHPPLQLRLAAPDEPGFVLETVPVRTLKDVWSVLDVVRQQCWLNEVLTACDWTPEGLGADTDAEEPDDGPATEQDLQAVLEGECTLRPRSIPVNVYLPASPPAPLAAADSLFDGALDPFAPAAAQGARIVMTSPERPPVSGLVEIAVTFDPARERGVAVDIGGAMGVDLDTDALEEVCRRGGVLGLPGRVWAKAHKV